MGGNAQQRPSEPGRPLSIRAIVVGGVLVGVAGAVAVAALLIHAGYVINYAPHHYRARS